uniref:Uncharacterized protein n=1 Tax=Sphaerodactylus townsendi TaxID=933632 RepID=A0ACB8FX37_9SAUR
MNIWSNIGWPPLDYSMKSQSLSQENTKPGRKTLLTTLVKRRDMPIFSLETDKHVLNTKGYKNCWGRFFFLKKNPQILSLFKIWQQFEPVLRKAKATAHFKGCL